MLTIASQGRSVRVVTVRCDRSGVNWATCENGRSLLIRAHGTLLFSSHDRVNPLRDAIAPSLRYHSVIIRVLNVSIAAQAYFAS